MTVAVQIGRTYRTRGGWLATAICRHYISGFTVQHHNYGSVNPRTAMRWHEADGALNSNRNEYDLVEDATEQAVAHGVSER